MSHPICYAKPWFAIAVGITLICVLLVATTGCMNCTERIDAVITSDSALDRYIRVFDEKATLMGFRQDKPLEGTHTVLISRGSALDEHKVQTIHAYSLGGGKDAIRLSINRDLTARKLLIWPEYGRSDPNNKEKWAPASLCLQQMQKAFPKKFTYHHDCINYVQ